MFALCTCSIVHWKDSLWSISSIKILLEHQTLFTIDFDQVCILLIQNNIQLPLVRLLPNNPVITHGFHDDFFILVHSVRQEFQDAGVYFICAAWLWQTLWNKKQETWGTWEGQESPVSEQPLLGLMTFAQGGQALWRGLGPSGFWSWCSRESRHLTGEVVITLWNRYWCHPESSWGLDGQMWVTRWVSSSCELYFFLLNSCGWSR